MASLPIHCPGCHALIELETIIETGDWRCARGCIGFWCQHRVPNHPVAEFTKYRVRDDADQTLVIASRAQCSWSGMLVGLIEEGAVRG